MKQLFQNYRQNNEMKKNTYQISFRNGETVSMEGYNENENKISRADLFFLIPWRAVRENILYFLLLILQAFSSRALYFVAFLLILQQWIVDCYNYIKIRQMDKMLKGQEARVIKQWDECISNKEIITKIKERLNQHEVSEEMQRQKSASKIQKDSASKRVDFVSNHKKGSLMSNESIPFQPIQYKQQQSQKQIKQNEKYNAMSSMIYKDMALKLQSLELLETDFAIVEFKKKVPCLFTKNIHAASKSHLNDKLKKMEKDKMNLVKLIDVKDIMIGDVIYLQRNQVAPCDIVVLHCNDENFCVQHQLCDYSQITVRKPVVQFKSDSQNLVQFKKSLTGNIMFTEYNQEIRGFFQLKKDPKSKIIGSDNFLYCQEKLLATPWVLGIVVKVGNSCRCYKKFFSQIKHENTQFFSYYIMVLVIAILQIIVFNQNHVLLEYRSVTDIIINNTIYLILMVPHFYKIYYNIAGLFQLKGIGSIDQKQIVSCHIDKYLDKQFLTMDVDSLIEQTFELQNIIFQNKFCEFEESGLFEFLINACKLTNPMQEDQEDDKQGSQVINYLMQSSGSDELFSQRECIANQIPKSFEGRFIPKDHLEQKEEMPLNQEFVILEDPEKKEKGLFDNQDIGDHMTAQRQSNQARSSKVQVQAKEIKYDKCTISQNELFIMMKDTNPEELNPLLLQLAMNHLAFSKLLLTEKHEQKVKNKFLGQLDAKQVNLAKIMGYEFICVNNLQNQQHYIVQLHGTLHSFKLVHVKLNISNQRLYMLFEMEDQYSDSDQQFILFLRESNIKKKDGIEDKVWKQQSDQIHYIYYQYCYLSQEQANTYLSTAQSTTSESLLYALMEQLLKINIVLGLKYKLKVECASFMKSMRKSEQQMMLYTQNQEIYSTSVLYQAGLLTNTDLIVHFNQENEEDLRAYYKQCLEEFSNIFNQFSINSQQYINHVSSPKLMLTDEVKEKQKSKKVFIMINERTFQIIMENTYFKNHLKLLLCFTKVLFIYSATQESINIFQEIWCDEDNTINLLYENQSLLRCMKGKQLQMLQLQQFSYFINQKPIKVDKETFFKNMILSLKKKLIYEKCYFNELQVTSSTDVVIQGFRELERLLFYQSPLLKIFFRSLYYQTVYKTLLFMAHFTFITILYTWETLDQLDYLIELVFYFYIYQLLMFMLQHYSFIEKAKTMTFTSDQSLLLRSYATSQDLIEIHLLMIFKSIFQGVLLSFIFFYMINDNAIYLYIFLSLSINDWLYCVIDFRIIEIIIGIFIFPIVFYIYVLFDSFQNDEWNDAIDIQQIFSIILGTFFMFLTNLLFEYFSNYNILPEVSEDFVSYFSYIQLLHQIERKKKTATVLQNKINDLFDNIEQVDLNIQKLLLNSDNKQSKFGQWKQQIFKKAQTILKWKQKQIIQCFQLLFYHSTFIIIMFFYQDEDQFFLIDYLINFFFQLIILIIQCFISLPTDKQEYLEYLKFILSTIATLSILFVMKLLDNTCTLLVIEYYIAYQLSIKFHPIYDFRIYASIGVSTMIGYIIWYIIQAQDDTYYLIATIQFIVLFSLFQYFVKSYFIQLEEDQAQNKMNFIEQNNKINDILGILLPKFIRDRLNETDQYNIHQNQGLVAIVFCDICNFDQMVIEEQANIINFLDDLFRTFDKLCQIHGVQKIETVGKTYLASAGLKACEQELTYLSQVDPVQRAVNLAEQMMNYIRSKMWGKQGQQLVGKIGIHYGRAISGVIGFHKPQFSLIGDTVNTTSRVCSTGLEDAITLSEQAFDQLKNETIEFEIRQVEMKGLGVRPTYIFKSKIVNKETPFSMQLDQDAQSKEARSNYVVRKNPEILKKNLKKRKTVLTQIDTLNQKMDSLQEKGTQNVFGIKPQEHTYYQGDDKSRHSIQLLNNQESDEKIKQSLARPNTFKRLVTMFQNKFQLENYEPEIDELIDYEQLLNVILLKNELTLENKLIKETSFLQLLEISYYQKQMNQFISYDEYMEFVKTQSKDQTMKNLRVYTLYYIIKQFCQIAYYDDCNIGIIVMQWVCCILNLIQFAINRKPYFEKWKFMIKTLLFFELLLSGLVIVIVQVDFLKNLHVYEIIFIQSLFCSVQILSFWIKVLFCVLTTFYSIIMIAIDGSQEISIFFIIVCLLYNLVLILFIEQQQVGCFNQKNIFRTQQQKESQLLQYLLPKHILSKFLDDRMVNSGQCDTIDNLTILFADIAGFTEYSSKVTPEEVLVMLKNLFVEFDRKCYQLNVYKLYTIGDCYVAIGMIDFNNRNYHQEAKNIVDLAFEMINIIAQVRKQINFDGLNMRIGVHTGSVFGGVMGTDIVRYDVYGPDVLIANKMESNGVKGFVQVSEDAMKLLEQDYSDQFRFEPNATVDLKAIKRKIEGYLVYKLEEDHFDQQNEKLSSL